MWINAIAAVVGGIVGGLVYLFILRSRPSGRDSAGRPTPATRWSAVGMGLAVVTITLGRDLLRDRGWGFAPALAVAVLGGVLVLAATSAIYTAAHSRPGRHRGHAASTE